MVDVLSKLLNYPELKLYASAVLAVFGFFFGEFYVEAVTAILMLFIFDTITGIAASVHEKNTISSRAFMRALYKAAIFFLAISASYFTDLTLPFNFAQAVVLAFVGTNELISIFENIGRLGYDTPQGLVKKLKQMRDKN